MPDTVIPFYSLTLGHLVLAKGRLVVWCRACRRTSRLDVVPVLVKLGPGERISDHREAIPRRDVSGADRAAT